jgi:hypothetical protein
LLPLHIEGAALGLDRLLKASDGLALLLEASSWFALVMLSTISSLSTLESSAFRPSSDFCAASRATRFCSSADRASARAACSCWSRPSAHWRAVRSYRSWPSEAASAATLASRAAFKSSASLALCSSARPLLSLALLRLRPLERRAEPPVIVADAGHLRLPVGRQRAHLLQVRARLPQRLIPVDEGCADPLEARGTRRVLPRALVKLIAQGHGPIREPAIRGPKGVGERVEGAASLPKLVELDIHLVEGTVLVAGAALVDGENPST